MDTNEAIKQHRSLVVIEREIRRDWAPGKRYFGAIPYMDAMSTMDRITEHYYADTGTSVVAYFLSNATTWRGEVARRVKKELNQMLKDAR